VTAGVDARRAADGRRGRASRRHRKGGPLLRLSTKSVVVCAMGARSGQPLGGCAEISVAASKVVIVGLLR